MGVSVEVRTSATAALSNFGNPKHILAFPLKTLSGKTRQSKPARKEDKMFTMRRPPKTPMPKEEDKIEAAIMQSMAKDLGK